MGGSHKDRATVALENERLPWAITFKDRTLFDDKVMLTPEYQWDGVKDLAAWKSRVERYFITKITNASPGSKNL